MTNYLPALFGGMLIGLSALMLAGWLGRVMGVSGILKAVIPPMEPGIWRYFFLVGIPLWVLIYSLVDPNYHIANDQSSYALAIVSGVLVGFGTSLANWCTSGHAVCGIGRLSVRSLVATGVFVSTGVVTLSIHHLIG
jgi:uncharacterized protein